MNGLTRGIAALLMILFFCTSCKVQKQKVPANEVMYHVFQRSFYDANGDQHGDLNGLREKLGYLQDLGITSILMTPLYESVYYHNYYSSNFDKIDPRYGSMKDYIDLVKEIHKRGMKIYMDMETQYVTEDHPWYKESLNNPSSKYSDYILYDDKAQSKPSSIVYNITELKGYDGTVRKITTVNLNSKAVHEYNYKLFKFWLDPNGDGKFDDGVDGYRLDHMMDDLDNKKRLSNLFATFWVPLINKLKQINPKLTIMAEQANWASYGIDYLEKAAVDRVFAFRIQQAIPSFNKEKIAAYADTTFARTPANKQQVVFIENHDIARFGTVVKQSPGKERVGAALNLLIGGVPSIYYGQEIGMLGDTWFGKYGGITDANEIPSREAFEWYKNAEGKGMAFWYKNTGPWWDTSTVKSSDGISYEEQKNNPASLWNFYRQLIALRKANAGLVNGAYKTLVNNNKQVYTFSRGQGKDQVFVAVNLSDQEQQFNITGSGSGKLNQQFGVGELRLNTDKIEASIPAYGLQVWRIED
ncbi:alpha-amylase family glycosyl hydrolase [Pedobacter caeni]|uniref:Glycosidase n=1 Tax=Pedobacter caeni TaxID=288992 RepID=A0A1M4T5V4_9SPHI|nr:alpha-amylase family glycosyl hydrolase [Pedobacter caeni]SHE39933.1 Glycosidase [Pedobacter caeni]